MLLLLLLVLVPAVFAAGGGGGGLPSPAVVTNFDCTDVPGFDKCCQEFSHPGSCFKIDSSDPHPEETCGNYCLLKGGPYGSAHRRDLGSESSDSEECTVPAERRRLGASSGPSTQCKTNSGDYHRRKLGGESSSSFCPVSSMYYLHDLNNTKCYDGSLITREHLDKSRQEDPKYCSFYDYNPATRVCCIPSLDLPAVPSFNRYTINREEATKKWDHRQLAGGGDFQWVKFLAEKKDSHQNRCAVPVEAHGLFELGGTLEYLPAFVMMLIIIIFTISCETVLAKSKAGCEYFNPLLMPCIDKIVAELMILGATAFAILIYNESTENSLANGTVMPVSWYHHLHWVDVTIFVFAIVYVMSAIYILLLLCENATRKLAMVDVCHRPEERPLVSDTKHQSQASQTYLMRADSSKKVAVAVAPELIKSLKKVLLAHRQQGSDLPEAARELLALELPGCVVDIIVKNVNDPSQEKLEKKIRAFLGGEHTEVEIKCSPYERRHLHMLLQPLMDMTVLTMVVDEASVTINKLPVATWFKDEEAVAIKFDGVPIKNAEPTFFSFRKDSYVRAEELTAWEKFKLKKHLQYVLVRHHFVSSFFGNASLDFVLYLELTMVFGITDSFNIGPLEWLCLLVACIPVTGGIGSLKSFEVFAIFCMIVLAMSITVTALLWNFFYHLIEDSPHCKAIKNAQNLVQLHAAVRAITATASSTSEPGSAGEGGEKPSRRDSIPFIPSSAPIPIIPEGHIRDMWAFQSQPQYVKAHMSRKCENAPKHQTADEMQESGSESMIVSDLINGPNLLHGARSDKAPVHQIYFYGVAFTDSAMQKFVQIQLLVSCFYVGVFLVTYLYKYMEGYEGTYMSCPTWFVLSIGSLLLNILVVMPIMMFLGFSLASMINPHKRALREMGHIKKQGESGIVYLKCLLIDSLRKQHKQLFFKPLPSAMAEVTDQEYNKLFSEWASDRDYLTNSTIREKLLSWAKDTDNEFSLPRPKLLAMMRIVDDDRSGTIGFKEFRAFAKACLLEKQEQEAAERNRQIQAVVDRRKAREAERQKISDAKEAEEAEALFWKQEEAAAKPTQSQIGPGEAALAGKRKVHPTEA